MGKDRIFDRSKFSVVVIVDGAPIDITDGLIVDGDMFEAEKEDKSESETRNGLNNESYTILAPETKTRAVTLRYLPAAAAVVTLQLLRKNHKSFGLVVKNDSAPRYVLSASTATVMEEPPTKINGKSGFADYEFKLRVVDADVEHLPND